MSSNKLIHTLNKIAARTMKHHPEVDYGGCCVVAAHMGKVLQSNNVSVRIRVLNSGDRIDIDKARRAHAPKSKRGWERAGLDFYHVVTEFRHNGESYIYDSTAGVRPFAEVRASLFPVMCDGALTVKEAKMLADTDDWNDCFDRSEIPHIRRRITRMVNGMKL